MYEFDNDCEEAIIEVSYDEYGRKTLIVADLEGTILATRTF